MHKPGLKIMYVLHAFDLAGSQYSMLAHAKSMRNFGHSIFFVGPSGPFEKKIKELQMDYEKKPNISFSPFSFIDMFCLAKIILKVKPDIIHSNNYWPHVESLLIGKALLNIPVVTTLAGGPVFNKPVINSGPIISYSDELKDGIVSKFNFDSKEILVVKNRLDLSMFKDIHNDEREINNHQNSFQTVLLISRLNSDKEESIINFFNNFKKICRKHKNLRCLVLGGGNIYNYIMSIANNANHYLGYDAFHLLGHKRKVLSYILQSDFVVGLGRSVMEGMAAGRPGFVLCKDGNLSLVTEENVHLHSFFNFAGRINFSDEEKLRGKENINKILTDNSYYKKISTFSKKYIFENYDVLSVQKILNKIYYDELSSYYKHADVKVRVKLFIKCLLALFKGGYDRSRHIIKVIFLKLREMNC